MVQLMIRRQMYSDSGKQRLGEAITEFIATRSLWPETLVDFLENEEAKKLTTRLLVKWMARETGWEFMEDKYYADSLERLLGRYKNFSHSPTSPAGDSTILMSAIAMCGIVRDERGRPIKTIEPLLRMLLGTQKSQRS